MRPLPAVRNPARRGAARRVCRMNRSTWSAPRVARGVGRVRARRRPKARKRKVEMKASPRASAPESGAGTDHRRHHRRSPNPIRNRETPLPLSMRLRSGSPLGPAESQEIRLPALPHLGCAIMSPALWTDTALTSVLQTTSARRAKEEVIRPQHRSQSVVCPPPSHRT
jgi:hypothetical protein